MAKINGKTLPAALKEIETALVVLVPEAVRQLKVEGPCYAVILCYIDSTTDEFTPYGLVAPEAVRAEALRADPAGAASSIWSPHQALTLPKPLPTFTLEDAAFVARCQACYQYLMEKGGDLDDDRMLLPFRKMMYRVAQQLNGLDWSSCLAPTDDFVVIASDWTGYWVEEDARASLPSAARKRLESRRLFFNGSAVLDQKAIIKRMRELQAGVARQPKEAQVQFWIGQLESMVAGVPCDVTQIGCDHGLAIDALQGLAGAAALPMAEFVRRHLDHDRAKAISLPFSLLSAIESPGPSPLRLHRLLREILAECCRPDAGKKVGKTTAYHCARSLHRLFPDYPKPEMAESGALKDDRKFFDAPMPTG